MAFIQRWMLETWNVLLEAGPYLMLGFLLAGVVHALISVARVTRHLGKPGLGSVLKAALVGIPLPLCSCSVIPVASALRREGASKGATAGFLITTPETGVDSIAATYALLGPFMAIVRPLAAFVSAVVAGLAIHRWDPDPPTPSQHTRQNADSESPTQATHCCGSTTSGPSGSRSLSLQISTMSAAPAAPIAPATPAASCCAHDAQKPSAGTSGFLSTLLTKARTAVRYGYGRMFEDLAHWLVLGFLLAGLIGALVPADFLERYLGRGLLSLVVMALVGLPMYVCATASTPVAAALMLKGLSPGAALVFLLVGPATNAATMVVVGRDLGRRSLAIYLLSIAVVALAFGAGTDLLVQASPIIQQGLACHSHGPASWLQTVSAIGLCGLILNGLRARFVKGRGSVTAASAQADPPAQGHPHASHGQPAHSTHAG